MRLIIINGATRGLGFAIVEKLVTNKEKHIYCLVHTLSNLSELEKLKNEVKLYPCDYSNLLDAKNTSHNFFAQIDCSLFTEIFFINNLSSVLPIDQISNLKSDSIINSINVNIGSNLIVIKGFLKQIKTFTGLTYLLNISSGISKSPKPGLMMYGLAKTYLDYLTFSVNMEKKIFHDRIFATSFYPGGIETEMQLFMQQELKKDSLSEFNYNEILKQKLEKPEKIAEIIFNNFIDSKQGWTEEIISKYRIINNG